MSAVIENCAGKVIIFQQTGGGTGFYKISPAISDAADAKCLIMGIGLNYQEIVQPVVTLDDKRSIYVFGSAWTECSVSGMLLLGKCGGESPQLANLMSWYDSNRISKKMGPISLSIGSKGVQAYVVGLRLEQASPEFNTQSFSIITLVNKDS